MKISIMWMTRKRSHELIYSFASFVNNADDNKNIEYFFVLDPDDIETLEGLKKIYLMAIAHEAHIKVIIMDKRYGYAELEQYQNAVGKVFTGECLFISNDDLICIDKGWDTNLRESLKPFINTPKWIGIIPMNEVWKGNFPIVGINRTWYNITKRISGTRYTDGYIERIGEELKCSPIQPKLNLLHLQRGKKAMEYINKNGERKIIYGLSDDGAGGYSTKNKIPPKYVIEEGEGKRKFDEDINNLKKWRDQNEKISPNTC